MSRLRPSLPLLTFRRIADVPEGSRHSVRLTFDRYDWHRFALGYKVAADTLAAKFVARNTATEAAALPVLFLYRHFVELSLKGMLLDAGELLDDAALPSNTHPLSSHWLKLRSRLNEIEPQDNSADWLDRAETLIAELDTLDRSSFMFRYPVDTVGRPNFPDSIALDIRNVSEVMDELEIVLDGIAAWLGNYLGIKREMENGFGSI